jgi:hypothetical protein
VHGLFASGGDQDPQVVNAFASPAESATPPATAKTAKAEVAMA